MAWCKITRHLLVNVVKLLWGQTKKAFPFLWAAINIVNNTCSAYKPPGSDCMKLFLQLMGKEAWEFNFLLIIHGLCLIKRIYNFVAMHSNVPIIKNIYVQAISSHLQKRVLTYTDITFRFLIGCISWGDVHIMVSDLQWKKEASWILKFMMNDESHRSITSDLTLIIHTCGNFLIWVLWYVDTKVIKNSRKSPKCEELQTVSLIKSSSTQML